MDLGIAGRACAVTGASRGIGLATAQRLIAAGADVLLIARGADALATAANACGSDPDFHGRAETLALDVTDEDAGRRIRDAAVDAFGSLDVLVNNAGWARWRDLADIPDEDWLAQYEINVMAPLRTMRAALPGMTEQGWGRIVNVSSTAGKRPSPNMPDYSVAKAAELSLTKLFADRYVGTGVLINAVAPGPVASEMWMGEGGLADQAADSAGTNREEILRGAYEKRPIGRYAEPAEVADVIAFLCSDRASYVAGSTWGVDGSAVPIII